MEPAAAQADARRRLQLERVARLSIGNAGWAISEPASRAADPERDA